ncbi:hypothetical protein GGX14DRAFT_526243 [Mycena pura]|uniref:Cytochrome b561 domain-containing protein n=1 Tax=Mycena pura TaxID=153505 RepID=A0AAD6Y566_9AGAR|nr:hypothetical protein GGX14DRAFT_526243 [Mycena pura]
MARRQVDRYSKSTMDPNAEDYELLLPPEQAGERKVRQEDRLPSEARKGDSAAMYLALIGAAVFTTVTWVVVLVNHPLTAGWFALHPILQSFSLLLLTYGNAPGILTLQPTSQPKTKAAGLVRHQYAIAFAAFPAIFAGTFAVMFNKYVHGAPHFVSWHAKFGIAAMAWIVVQVLIGGGSVWFGGAAFGGGAKAKALWKYHRLSGYVLYVFLMLTAHLGGYWSNWGNNHSPSSMRILAFAVALLACVSGVYMRIRPSKMKFF